MQCLLIYATVKQKPKSKPQDIKVQLTITLRCLDLCQKAIPWTYSFEPWEKKKVYPKVVSCNQQKVVLDTVQQIAAFLSTAQAAEEFHNLAQLTPSSYADGPYVCDVPLFTSLCSELAFFQQFFLCLSTDRACGQLYNSIMQTTTLIIKSVYQVTTEEQGSPPWPSHTLHHCGTI